MPGCAAFNCSNSTEKGFRMFRFPKDKERRDKWKINCRRGSWTPSQNSRLCHVHFEESQYEQKRQDKLKKLKQTAIPTLFEVPNPPAVFGFKCVKGKGLPKSTSILPDNSFKVPAQDDALIQRIAELELENMKLKLELQKKDKILSFLSPDQIQATLEDHSKVHWSKETIIKCLKLRLALGKFGYNYLRSVGYPAPSCSTLNRKIQGTFPNL